MSRDLMLVATREKGELMKVLVTGGKGMLGRTLKQVLGKDFKIVAIDVDDVDITDKKAFSQFIQHAHPDVVIHCAAFTNVDKCEEAVDLAYQVNEQGTANVAKACQKYGARLIAISTDYVFDGNLNRPYNEFDTATGGATVYGQSKFAGEEQVRKNCLNHCICRISWLYGPGGPSFVHAMLGLADGTRSVLKVVADQHGNPTSTFAVAQQLKHLLLRPELRGTFHMTCEGEATWADFAKEIFHLANKKQVIQPCSTEEFPRPAPRPKNSRLEKRMFSMVGLPVMPDWRQALAEFMAFYPNI